MSNSWHRNNININKNGVMKLSKNFKSILHIIINIIVGSIIIFIPIGIIVAGFYLFGELLGAVIIVGGVALWGAHSVGEFFINKFND